MDLQSQSSQWRASSAARREEQVWLKAGDKVVTSIEKLGDLAFTLTWGIACATRSRGLPGT
jgi:hypothetical protein